MMECYYIAMDAPGELKRKGKVSSIGPPMVNTEVKIVDENDNCVPRNTRGELWVRSCTVMTEYMGQPELTNSVLDQDGWLRTG